MIYIVEDDSSIRELEQYALQTNGYEAKGFADGASFWLGVRAALPDLVILDVMLPDEDGYQILRAGAPAAEKLLRFGGIEMDDAARTVRADGETVELTFKEYALLHLFLEHPGQVLARERIMKEVWDTDDLLESRTIDMHVRTLRQKLGPAGECIRTVRKVGYKLSSDAED